MGSLFTIPIPVGDENIHVLKNEWAALNRKKNDVQRWMEDPEMRCLDAVQGWILRVEANETKVKKLIDNIGMPSCAYRPWNWKARYKFGKEVAKMIKELSDLKSKIEWIKMNRERFTIKMEPTFSLESTFDKAWRYIRDDEVGFIGIYGMGGVGKTTLLTKINDKLSIAPHDFDVIIWVFVSKNPSLEKLQEEIGKKIGNRNTTWVNKSHDDKAVDIFSVLSSKRFVLLLDDIWERFDLLKVGIPHPDIENKSKVVFTTRSEYVCGRMGGKKVGMKFLEQEEAFELFSQKVGEDTLNAHPEIRDLAYGVSIKCGGLPLALITTGRAMSCKSTSHEWRCVRSLFKGYTARFHGMESLFSFLKFSYDSLPNKQVRSCFLYCSLFPEDSHIPKHKLISYWFGEGFLDEYKIDGNSAMLEGGYDVIDTLVHACLLEADENGDIKMHDMIRDMALWISRNNILVQTQTGLNSVSRRKWKKVERISLMGNHIKKLKAAPSCYNLATLLLNDNRLNMIGHEFFRSLQGLRVLDLSANQGLIELPSEIHFLISLQYLNLSGTGITKLPVEMGMLWKLRYLDLTYTYYLHTFPIELVSCCKLEVLKMIGCGSSDLHKEDSSFWGRQRDLVHVLDSLDYLHDLSITIRHPNAFKTLIWSRKLKRSIRRLGCSHINVKLNDFVLHMDNLERLEIVHCVLESSVIFPTIPNKSCLGSLRSVFVVRCSMVSNLTWLRHAENLEILLIAYCTDMREIINDCSEINSYQSIPFSRLKELHLIELPQLGHVHRGDDDSPPFPCLKYIGVEGCPMLMDLALNSESAKGCGLTIQGEEDWWDNIKSKYAVSFEWHKSERSTSTSASTSTNMNDDYLPHFKSFE